MNSLSLIKDLIESGQFIEAKKRIQLLDDDPLILTEVYSIKTVIAIMEGNLAEAERLIVDALKIDPNHSDLLFNMAYIFEMRTQYEEARQFYKLALKNSNSSDTEISIFEALESIQEKIIAEQTEQPLVSIVVLAYNKLEYTKLCVESILKFTGHINYELITVDNGSSDGTRKFFHSIPNARVVYLKDNVGPSKGFNEGIKVARGKYTACVCNDSIFTPRWMDNLLTCIESDESIGFVSPGANIVSNGQNIKGSYKTIGEMFEFANSYNHSDSSKWEERVRLIPCVLMVRTALLREIEGYDGRFYYGEFADDDISFRIRRKGYKLIYCKDTFTYHYGSVTTIKDQEENNSRQISREIFINKYNLDAWTDAVYNPVMINFLSEIITTNNVEILGINTKCGGNPLQLRNLLRQKGIDQVKITNYCSDEKYLVDVRTVSDEVIWGEISHCSKKVGQQEYDVIIAEHDLGIFVQYPGLIDEILDLLKEVGYFAFLFKIENETEIDSISHLWDPKLGYKITYKLFADNDGDFIIIVGEKGI